MAGIFGVLAFILAVLLGLAVTFYLQTKGELKAAQDERNQIQQQANAALARYKSISDLEKYKEDLQTKLNNARAILPKFQKLSEMEKYKAQLTTMLEELKRADSEWREEISANDSGRRNAGNAVIRILSSEIWF